jgi:hypothetical protein
MVPDLHSLAMMSCMAASGWAWTRHTLIFFGRSRTSAAAEGGRSGYGITLGRSKEDVTLAMEQIERVVVGDAAAP